MSSSKPFKRSRNRSLGGSRSQSSNFESKTSNCTGWPSATPQCTERASAAHGNGQPIARDRPAESSLSLPRFADSGLLTTKTNN